MAKLYLYCFLAALWCSVTVCQVVTNVTHLNDTSLQYSIQYIDSKKQEYEDEIMALNIVTHDYVQAIYDERKATALQKRTDEEKAAAKAKFDKNVERVKAVAQGGYNFVSSATKGDTFGMLDSAFSLASCAGPAGAVVGEIGKTLLSVFGPSVPSETQVLREEMHKRFDQLSAQLGEVSNQIQEGFNEAFGKLDAISSQLKQIESKIDALPDRIRDVFLKVLQDRDVNDIASKANHIMQTVSVYMKSPSQKSVDQINPMCRNLHVRLGSFLQNFQASGLFRMKPNDFSYNADAMVALKTILQTTVFASNALNLCFGISFNEREMAIFMAEDRARQEAFLHLFKENYGYSLKVKAEIPCPSNGFTMIGMQKYSFAGCGKEANVAQKVFGFNSKPLPRLMLSGHGRAMMIMHDKCNDKVRSGPENEELNEKLHFMYRYKCKTGFFSKRYDW